MVTTLLSNNILEYCDMAIRLGYSVTKENRDKVYNELSRMKISDITNLYPNLLHRLQICFISFSLYAWHL